MEIMSWLSSPADVERIEVISGPGRTLWGANAMNGVINVITKRAGDTQGGLIDAKAGDVNQRAAARWLAGWVRQAVMAAMRSASTTARRRSPMAAAQ
jgi:outer membrane receptor protein involved in Fe transport